MAFETELANSVHPTDVISSAMSPALVQETVMLPIVYTEDLPSGTPTKRFGKKDYLTAEDITESTAYTFSANSEIVDTELSVTAAGSGVVSKLTLHAKKFGTINKERIYDEQASALARAVESKIKTLFSGFSNQVTSTTILTVNDLMQALYLVQSNTAGVSGGQLVAALEYKGVNEIRKEIMSSGAAVFTQSQQTSLLAGVQQGNGFVGNLPGLDLYQMNGLPTDTGDDVGLVMDPDLAIAGIVGLSPDVMEVPVISGGFYDEIGSAVFSAFGEWNDSAGVGVKSDT